MDEQDNNKTIPGRTMPERPIKRLRQEKGETAVLASTRRRRNLPKEVAGTSSLGSQKEVLLMIRGMIERILLKDDLSVVIGRTDLNARFNPDVDLTTYGAIDRGVSRAHARLHLEDGHLYITDLGSTNGTFVSGNRLEPNEPHMLHKGEELLLGRLPVQILF